MKKKPLPRRTWMIAALIVGVLFVGSGVGLIWSFTASAERVEEHTAYSYSKEADLDYRVRLLPNELFQERELGPGRAYLSRLTDYLNADLHYRFEGERDAQIEGAYSAVAYLTALSGRDEDKRVVWERQYLLLSPKGFEHEGSELTVRETVKVPFAEYRAFAEEVREKTEFNPSELNLRVEFDLQAEIQTDSGTVEDQFRPYMVLSMRGDTFVVEGDFTDSNSRGITEERIVSVPQVEGARKLFTVSSAIFAGVLAALLSLTTPVQKHVNPQEKEVARLLKKHEERIAVLSEEAPGDLDHAVAVTTFDDLLKVADELQRPIFYCKRQSATLNQHLFLVLVDEIMYAYSIEA